MGRILGIAGVQLFEFLFFFDIHRQGKVKGVLRLPDFLILQETLSDCI